MPLITSDLGPAAPHRVAITPPKSPLTHFSLSRNSSLEGLAALRHSSSILPQWPAQSSESRPTHQRDAHLPSCWCTMLDVEELDVSECLRQPAEDVWCGGDATAGADMGAMRDGECVCGGAAAGDIDVCVAVADAGRGVDFGGATGGCGAAAGLAGRHYEPAFADGVPGAELLPVPDRGPASPSTSPRSSSHSPSSSTLFASVVPPPTSIPWSLTSIASSFLLKPIQRLIKYPLFYKQLCEVTPPAHPDYEATVCLLSATDSVIRVLQEVKEREDEYEKLQEMEGRIKGLPAGFKLTRRDRRLLAQGLMERVQLPPAREEASDSPVPWTTTHGARPERQNQAGWSPMQWSGHSSKNMSSSPLRSSYWSQWNHQSGSSSGESSVSPGALKVESTRKLSPQRYSTASANRENKPPGNPLPRASKTPYSWGPPPRSLLTVNKDHYLCSQPALSLRAQSDEQQQQQQRGLDRRKSMPVGRPSISARKPKETPVHVFVFSDLVPLAMKHSDGVRLIRSATTKLHLKKKEPQSYYYSLVDHVGLSTLLSVEDLSGHRSFL
ncbi:uncharacterized protein VP01_1313g5 [Puccinia sorghi]|uniref:DH domain-containing protein n=1 Tax=Puccinia sorghi TaxID=27349 RepID=A0A0L6VMW5_9BASI|nr:uncharacterized protein VP01_1313g5 [Puccinia sorghi]